MIAPVVDLWSVLSILLHRLSCQRFIMMLMVILMLMYSVLYEGLRFFWPCSMKLTWPWWYWLIAVIFY